MKKIVLVVGGSSEIGSAYIEHYSDRYDSIVCTYYKNFETVKILQSELGNKLIPYKLNLMDDSEVAGFKQFLCTNSLLPGYVLYLPSLMPQRVRATEIDVGILKNEMEVSVISFLSLMKPILLEMGQKKFGRVCCMLSSVTVKPVPFECTYMVTKFALLGAVKALAAEFASKHVIVNAISPSMIDTKFVSDPTGLLKKKRISTHPLKRLASVEDVLQSISFFLDDQNEYVTGENMLIAGGGIIS